MSLLEHTQICTRTYAYKKACFFDFDSAAWSPGLATKIETGVISSPGHRRTKVALSERAEQKGPAP